MRPFLYGLALGVAACGVELPHEARSLSVDTVPLVDIYDPDATEEQLLEFPTGATRLSNGNIVVNDSYAATVVYFDSTGKLLRKVGGHGRGPGEFGGAVIWQGQCARDSVFVLVADLGQVAVLDSAGRTARTFRPDQPNDPNRCNRDGEGVVWDVPMTRVPREKDPPLKGKLYVGKPGRPRHFIADVETEYGPLRPYTQAVVANGNVFVGSGATGSIEMYSKRGKTPKTIETGAQRRPVTSAQYDAALDRYVTYLVLHDDRVQMKKFFKERFRKPDRAPAYNGFHVDSEGILWTVVSLPGDGNTVMRTNSVEDGRPGGVITLPVELTIFEIGRNHILGYYEGEEGFPHVAMYRVTRS